eukprot:PhM_4_TR12394/c0_g1_i1/m.10981
MSDQHYHRTFALGELCTIACAAAGAGAALTAWCLNSSSSSVKGSNDSSVRSVTASGSAVYDSQRALHEYLHFHYATTEQLVPYPASVMSNHNEFPKRVADIVTTHSKLKGRVLDIGCAVGRTTFELCRGFKEAVGVDFSALFIKGANILRDRGTMEYVVTQEGDILAERTASVPTGIDVSRAQFFVGDACNLDPSLGKFDAVVAANLLDRLPQPERFLSNMRNVVNRGGVLVTLSPYSWLPEYTDKAHWLGGTKASEEQGGTLAAIERILGDDFERVHVEDVAFLIREHRRKFQLGVSQCAVFKKK